ncbi:MAG: cyclic nucleotide-binding domain-containing protein [Devosia sp.]
MDIHWIEMIGYGGTAMTALSYSMRTIVPLRIAGIASSVFFIAYGLSIQSWPMLATEFIILPLNIVRLFQLLRLLKQTENASGDEFEITWLEPFSKARRLSAGEILFRSGDKASELYVVHSGRYRIVDRDIEFGSGQLMGELGFLSPDNLRTATLECVVPGEVGVVTYFDLKQLFFQNPKFGFYLMKLIAARLFENEAHARTATPVRQAAE